MFVCSCTQVPVSGSFTIGSYYDYTYLIDGVQIGDDSSTLISLGEKEFKSCFVQEEPVTAHLHIWDDHNVYSLYLVLMDDKCSIEEIRACAKLLNINYLQAKKTLNQKRNLIVQGKAYAMQDICKKLAPFPIQYEIDPPYPYPYCNARVSKEGLKMESVDLYQSLVSCLVRVSHSNECIAQIEKREAENGLNTVLEKLEDGDRKILDHYISEVYSGGILEVLRELELLGEFANMAVTLRNHSIPNDLFRGIVSDYVKCRNGWQWPDN